MKQLFLLLLLAGLTTIFSCESELEDETACNPDVLAVTASVSINEANECYLRGGLGFNAASNRLSLILFSPRNNTGEEIDVQFEVLSQEIPFNQSLAVAAGEYSNAVPVSGGTIILTEDNFPEDPSLLQYKGMIDLTFQSAGSSNIIDVSGTFSFEKP